MRLRSGPSTFRPRWGKAFAVLSILVVSLGVARLARAFPPDDEVFDISVSPEFADDGTLFAVVGRRLLRSQDRGESWSEVVRGLTEESQPVRRVEVAPSDASRVYVVTRTDAIHASVDGGESFGPANGGLDNIDISEVAVSPTSADTVLAAGSGARLFRTTDGGATWVDVDVEGRVLTPAFLPDGQTALAGRSDGRLLRSTDGGVTWDVDFELEERTGISALAVSDDGGSEATVVIGSEDGDLLVSDDGGVTFDTLDAEGIPNQTIAAIALSSGYPDDDTMWLTTVNGGVFASTDGGATFVESNDGVTVTEIDFSEGAAPPVPQFGPLAVAPDGDTAFLGSVDGLYVSTDGASSWDLADTMTEYLVGLAVSPAFADDGTVVVTSYVKGAFLSTDGGDSWEPANEGIQVAELGPGNEYAPLRRLHAVVFSPDYANDDTIFTANWIRVLRSTDQGSTWDEIDLPLPADADEDDQGTVLRQFVIAPSPQFADDQLVLAGTRQGEVYRSTAAGDEGTWELASTLPSRVRTLALSPEVDDDGIVFAGTIDGVYRSEDGGDSWDSTGVFIEHPLGDQSSDPAAHVAISPAFGDDGTVFAGTDRGLFVSHDGGEGWDELLSAPLTTDSRVEAVAVSPDFADDGTVLVSTRADGLLRSTDGGATFAPVGAELLDANRVIADFDDPTSEAIQFSPAFGDDQTVFGFAQTDVVRSTDGGVSWEVLDLPTGTEVRESLGDFEAASAGSTRFGNYIDTPIGHLSVKRIGASVFVGLLAFLGIQLLARGTDTPRQRRMRIGLEWSFGFFLLALLVLAG